MSGYPYADPQKQADPRAYMYTPYGGAAFLGDYFAAREAALERLGAALERRVPGGDAPALLEAAHAALIGGAGEEGGLVFEPGAGAEAAKLLGGLDWNQGAHTVPLLRLMARCLAGEGGGVDAAWPLLLHFGARLEISRKIWDGYEPGLRTGRGGHGDVLPYALLAACLGLGCMARLDLRLLNALLKAGDRLCATGEALAAHPEAAGAAFAALTLESALVWHVLERSGVHAD